MAGLFLFLYEVFKKYRVAFFAGVLGIALLAGYVASKIELEEDISKAMPADEKTKKLSQVFSNSRFIDKLIVHISLPDTNIADPDQLTVFADTIIERLQKNYSPQYIREITGITSDEVIQEVYDSLYHNLPLYLEDSDFARIEELLSDSMIRKTLKRNYVTMLSPTSMFMKESLLRDPLNLTPLVLKKLIAFQFDENFEIYNGYIITKNKKHLLFFITPTASSKETGQNTKLIAAIDETISKTTAIFDNKVKANYFGAVAVAVANAVRIKKDIQLTVTLSIIMLMLYLGFYFKRISLVFIIFLPLVFGGLISLAFLAVLKTKVSIIALGLGGILLGITIDYSLHILSHFRDSGSAKAVIRELAFPLLMSCLITAADFLCLLFVKSSALQDLGLFAAISVINAALMAIIILPQLLGMIKSKPISTNGTSKPSRFFAWEFDKSRILISVLFIFSVFSAFILNRVSFEGDMMKMNFMPDDLQESESELNSISHVSQKSVFLVSTAATLDMALRNNERLSPALDAMKDSLIIKKYTSVSTLLISDSLQNHRINKWKNFWSEDRKLYAKKQLVDKGKEYKFTENAFSAFYNLLDKKFESREVSTPGVIKDKFLHDYIDESGKQATVITLVKVDDIGKPAVYKTFDKQDNLLVFDKQYLTNRFVNVLKDDFALLANLSFFLVLFILILSYGRMELGIIAFLPMLLAWIWILGIMVLTGIKFNIINIIISTFICGLGIDYSIFMMSGLLHEYKYGKVVLPGYKKSIFLSATTTIIGVSALLLAKHPALSSIAVLSVIGMLCVVLMSYTIEPFFFKPMVLNRKAKGKIPWTFLTFILSVFAFTYFLMGCIVLTLAVLVLKMLPFPLKHRKYVFHVMLSTFTGSLIYIMFNVKKKIINPNKENFKTPAVVIANHQSFLDILLLTMINPKMVLLTNDWVYNSPIFGMVVKFADFYPVSSGFENSIDSLKEKVANGYSIVVWPEGTRSLSNKIGRFHKGAFFIAEQLQIDILPIILHGTGDTMTKGDDMMLKNGRLTLKYLDRITPTDIRYGNNFAERTKMISRFFKSEFTALRLERETPAYFRDKLVKNYIYKGPILEWYLRIKLRLENDYTLFNSLMPRSGTITDIGCGYGFMAYMLGFLSADRKITGIDYDGEKIEVANNCVSKTGQFIFISGDITQMKLEPSDAFILSDVLHYFPPVQQRELVQKCIQNLNPGGTLIIRDGNAEMKTRHKGTRLTEFFSTRFGFNKTNYDKLFFLNQMDIENYLLGCDVSCEVIDNTQMTSNIIFVIRNKRVF